MILAVLLLVGELSESSHPAVRASPQASWEEGSLRVRIPSQVLLDVEVRRVIQSGLTVTFLFDFAVPRARLERHARLEVRYEPWDETYLTSLLSQSQKREETFSSFDSLAQWWEALPWTVSGVPRLEGSSRAELKITISVVPFSANEERDARHWFAQSIEEPRDLGSPPAAGGPGAQSARDDMLGALITTAIKRRALRTFRWTVTIPEQERR
ncbi:MAG TPA: hypothetical protein VKJ00_12210 [Thermoanaerobaculia bacterium]|nr:hypothetical protein [Thermoanaerobaculia bacterium]